MSSGPRRAPRLAGFLLDLFDPTGAVRGDLDEEYLRYRRAEHGPLSAAAWYWGQTLRSLPHLMRRSGDGERSGLELAQALRMIRRRPGPSLLIVLTFALALGANTSVFSLAFSIVLRPLPFANQDRLVRIHPDELFSAGAGDAVRVAELATTAERILPWGRTLFTLTDSDPAAELRGGVVAHDHFQSLGTQPFLGRLFTPQDGELWPADAVILSHDAWARHFGADPAVVGSRITVGGRQRTLVGIMGPEHVPMEPDWEAWSPLPVDLEAAGGNALALNALLRPGTTLGVAQEDLRRALGTAWREGGYSVTDADLASIRVIPLREHLLGGVRTPLMVLLGAVAFILLLACANVANLLLAQGETRGPEVAVRASLGASRGRILRQLAAEVGLLALAGAFLAFLLSAAIQGWAGSRLPASFPRTSQWSLGGTAALYTLAVSLLAALLAGAVPAWRTAGGGDAARVLRGAVSRRGRKFSGALVAVQVAASLVLVVGSGLMVRTFVALTSVDPGFRTDGTVVARVSPPRDRYPDAESLDAYYGRLREAALAMPGVDAAGSIMFLPMSSGGAWASFRTDDAPDTEEPQGTTAFRIVTPGYFEAMGVPLLAGRAPDASDRPDGLAVAAINETLAREAFGDVNAVGRTLLLGREDRDPIRVVGVVGDVRQSDLRTDAHPELYRPLAQSPFQRLYLVANTRGDATQALAGLQAAILSVDDDIVLSRVSTLQSLVDGTVSDTRLLTQLLTLFGLVALALGGVGIYGVTAHSVAAHRREMGIRMALGADTGGVVLRTLYQAAVPVLVGIGLGLGGAAGSSRVLEDLLFRVEPLDPVTFGVVPAVLGTVALLAVAVPLVRAAHTDPVEALRVE